MKTILKEKAGPGAVVKEMKDPKPGPKEVLIRVKEGAICGSDVPIYEWDSWAQSVVPKLPQILGHEFAGEVRHLKGALKKAFKWKLLREPVQFPPLLPEEEKLRFLTVEQLQTLLAGIDDPEFYDMCLLAAFTGLRNGEIIRLSWSDVDNREGFIRVPSWQKSKKEDRIPINANARAVLARAKLRRRSKVFKHIRESEVSHKFKRYVIAAGLPADIRFHDLRHTFASHLAMNGQHPKAIQKLLRHASPASTDIYMKLSPEHLRDVSARQAGAGPVRRCARSPRTLGDGRGVHSPPLPIARDDAPGRSCRRAHPWPLSSRDIAASAIRGDSWLPSLAVCRLGAPIEPGQVCERTT